MTEESHIKLAFKKLMNDADFLLVMQDFLLNDCKLLGSAYDPDPHSTYYRMGMQAAGITLFNKLLEHAPSQAAAMLKDGLTNA